MTAIIVGASLAGGRAAEALRDSGYDGRVVLIGEEADRPYERPPLSKGYLNRTVPAEKLFLRAANWYADNAVELRLGARARRLDTAARCVELAGGERLQYDKLLIATGCGLRRIKAPGAELDGIHYLRTRADADRLAAPLHRAARLVVVGAGFIGLEVAATARGLGRAVTVIEALPIPLARALGARMGEYVADVHRAQGVDLRLSRGVKEFRGAGRLEEVVLDDGSAVPCDLAVVGVGVTPAVEWLAESGIALDNGVVVNEFAETNVPGIYAAGDVANGFNPLLGERCRVEHYDNAQNQGIAAGRAMAGRREPYAPVPYFWSDQYDLTLQFAGHAHGGDELVLRGDPAARSFSAFYLRDGRVRAALALNRPRDFMAARRLIQSGKAAVAAQLADEQVELKKLLA
jgi:3-phenylpropionate/trans-cinnamate dioxygenase ferredoxin reductase component